MMSDDNRGRFVIRVSENSPISSYESSDGSSTDASGISDSREVCTFRGKVLAILPNVRQQLADLLKRYPFKHSSLQHFWRLVKIIENERENHLQLHKERTTLDTTDRDSRYTPGLRDPKYILKLRFESSSDDSNTDSSDLDDCREVCTFMEDVLGLLPYVEQQLLDLSKRYPNIEHSQLKHLWDLVQIIQNEREHHRQFHEDFEIEEYDLPRRDIQENINTVKDKVSQEKTDKSEICYDLIQAQKQTIHQLEHDINTTHEYYQEKIKNLKFKYKNVEKETTRQSDSTIKHIKTETTKLKREITALKQGLRYETEMGNTNRSQKRILSQTIDTLQNKIDEYHHENQLLCNNLRLKESNLLTNEKEIASLTQLLKTQTDENARLKDVNQQLSKEKSELQSKMQLLLTKSVKQGRDSRQKQISNDNITLKRKIGEMEREIERLRSEIRNKIENMKNEKNTEKEYIHMQNLREKNNELLKEVDTLQLKIKLLSGDLLQEKKKSEQVENECKKTLKQTNKEKASLKTSAEETQRHLSEKISELENEVEKLVKDKQNVTEDFVTEKTTRNEKGYFENSKLQQKYDTLQKEASEMRQENQSLKNTIKSERDNFKTKEKELQSKVRQLLKENKKMTEDLTRANETVGRNDLSVNQNLQETYETLQKDVDQLQTQNRQLNDALRQEKKNVKKMGEDHSKVIFNMQKQIETQQQDIISLKAKLAENAARSSKVHSRGVNTNYEQDLLQRLKDTMNQLKHVQKELDDTKSRLSRAMGDKLTDNNPNIADLSDKNRPTKISERYQELYDNQWTDAFEIVNGTYRNEENTINILRIILKDTLEFCQAQAANQMIQIKASFLKGEELPGNMVKQVKECRKTMAEQYGKQLYKEYWGHLSTSKSETASHAMRTQNYVKECFEICWLMTVQDPPVVFGPDIRRGDTFNKDHYKAYTKSGDRVEYVVWPVLLLHQNGPVLCKGVAQGK